MRNLETGKLIIEEGEEEDSTDNLENKQKKTELKNPYIELKEMFLEGNYFESAKQELTKKDDKTKIEVWAAMKRISPEEFNKDKEINKELSSGYKYISHIFRELNNARKYKDFHIFLQLASDLKTLAPEKFNSEIKITKADWDEIAKYLEERKRKTNEDAGHQRVDWRFLKEYKQARELGGDEINKRTSIDELTLKRMQYNLIGNEDCIMEAESLSAAQAVKPENSNDLPVNESDWEVIKSRIMDFGLLKRIGLTDSLRELKIGEKEKLPGLYGMYRGV